MPESKLDGCVFSVMVLMKNGEHKISLDDTDVKIILESLTQKDLGGLYHEKIICNPFSRNYDSFDGKGKYLA